MAMMCGIMSKLRLTVNETKTRQCRVPEETFDFLGYTIRRCWPPKTGKAYIGTKPSAKKIARLKREISDQTSRNWYWMDVKDKVAWLNRMFLDWSSYFYLGSVSTTCQAVNSMRDSSFVSGFRASTSDRVGENHGSPISTCTMC
jgi:hypothetical protein